MFDVYQFFSQILLSEARVLGLGPRFMSIYVQKLAVSALCPLVILVFIVVCIFHFLYSFKRIVYTLPAFRLSVEYIMMKLKGCQ